ncbi:MAG: hypothetical protein ACE5ES_05115 [Candidatus Nanoarchaeia archaeon]
MKKRGNKKAQMKLSFGMIFSIILIIIFIAFAFYAIKKFLGLQESVIIGDFTNDFQRDVDKIWRGSQGSQEIKYNLPKKIQYVCLTDFESGARGENREFYRDLQLFYHGDENLFFYPAGSADGLDSKEIEHLDIEKITEKDNPYCIENINGKIKLRISMNFGESLVVVS